MTPREPKYLVDRAAEEVGAWHDALRAIVHSVIVHPVPKGAPMQIEVFGQLYALTADAVLEKVVAGARFGVCRWPEEQNEFAIFARDFRRFEGLASRARF